MLVSGSAAICHRYGIDIDDPQARSMGYFVLLALGYLFIGLAAITLIGANWDEIPRALRMAGLVAATVAVNLVGVYRFHRGERRAAVGFLFLGALFYGASIMLIAQIYHLGEHYPDGILWWALGVLPPALLLDSVLLMTLAATLAFIWFFVESGLGFYPAVFPLFMATLAWQIGRGRQSNLLYLALWAAVAIWAEHSLAWWLAGDGRYFAFGAESFVLGAGLLLVLYALGQWQLARAHGRWLDYGALTAIWTPRLGLLLLVVMSFEEPWRDLIRYDWRAAGTIVALALVMAGAAVALARAAGARVMPVAAYASCLVGALLAVLGLEDTGYAAALQVAANLVLVATGIGLIAAGIRQGQSHAFYLGVLAVLATGLLRYVDLVGDYVGAALLCLAFAILMLSAARYWRRQQAGAQA